MRAMSRHGLIGVAIASSLLFACGNDVTPVDMTVVVADMSIPEATELAPANTLKTPCMAVDAQFIYWNDQGPPAGIKKVPLAGGTAQTVTMGGAANTCVVLSGGYPYYTDAAGGFDTVTRVAVAGGAPSPLASNQHVKSWLATDGSDVYWGTDVYGPGEGMYSGKDAIVRVPVGGGAPQIVYMDLQPTPEARNFFVDAANVYYSDGNGVHARAKAGGGTALDFGMSTIKGNPFAT